MAQVTAAIYKGLIEPFTVFFPYSESKKKDFLELAREKVSFYKPKIESEFGVKLDDIKIKNMRSQHGDYVISSVKDAFEEYAQENKTSLNLPLKCLLASPHVAAGIIASPLIFTAHELLGQEAKHQEGTIYFPFGYMNRFLEITNPGKRKSRLDQTIVHELSHNLWYSLGGNGSKGEKFEKWRLWNEGFATYCANNHFSHLYPEEVVIENKHNPKLYERGRNLINQLVAIEGPGVLAKIPTIFSEFDAESYKTSPR